MFFLVLLRWLNFTFRHYSAIPWPLTWLPIVPLAAYCGLYFGAVAARGRLGSRPLGGAGRWRWRPLLWVAASGCAGSSSGRLPVGLLGYSQYRRCCR